ncbi:MAG: polysaccharide ABC transporter ATP-binding protein [Archangium sp.]|nr:polysaccharide ABC transporter ATP-binding protein [Archangium sp.]
MTPDAIVINNVFKSFKKTSKKNEYTTMKSELVRLLTFQRRLVEPGTHIEALKGVDLRIPRGSTVGIIGRNGSGKSTLLKLMTGIYSPTTGTIDVHGRISALLELGAGFHPDFTGRENILINGIILGMSRAEVKERMPGIIEFAELGDFIDEPVRTYSSGMFMRLAFAVATHVEPDVLIIDEIMAVGDEHFSRKSQVKMNEFRRSGKTIVLVTHDLATVQNWCSAAAWIDGGRIRMYGSAPDVVNEYRRAVAAAEAEGQKTGHSALDQPGLALPSMGQVHEAVAPLGTISAVRLTDGKGATPVAFSPDAGLTVEVDWTLREKAKVRFGLDLMSADGRLVFSTGWDGGELSGSGTARLELARLGLGGGVYELLLSVAGNGEPVKNPFRLALHVAATEGVGLLRPELRWSL